MIPQVFIRHRLEFSGLAERVDMVVRYYAYRDCIYVYVLHGTSGNRYFQLVASTRFISNIYSGLKNTHWTLLRLLVLRGSSRRLTV